MSLNYSKQWRGLARICNQLGDRKTTESTLPSAAFYNNMLQMLCQGHDKLYNLVSVKLTDVPALKLDNMYAIKCTDNIASQALVATYLLRDYFYTVVKIYKDEVANATNILEMFLRSFDSFSTFSFFLKCCFNYLHWIRLKWGIPSEHTIFSSEYLAKSIWSESIHFDNVSTRLAQAVFFTVRDVLAQNCCDFERMENVKRFALYLHLNQDIRHYKFFIVLPFQDALERYYKTRSAKVFKACKSVELYVKWCGEQIRRGTVLSYCFLHSSSYRVVRQLILQCTVAPFMKEIGEVLPQWLFHWRASSGEISNAENLSIIYKCVACNREQFLSWFEKAFQKSFEFASTNALVSETLVDNKSLWKQYNKLFSISRDLFFRYTGLIHYVLEDKTSFVNLIKEESYQIVVANDAPTSPALVRTFAQLLVTYAGEKLEGNREEVFSTTGLKFYSWVACVYSQCSEDVRKMFDYIYSSYLFRRVLRSIAVGKENFFDVEEREKKMLMALSGVAPYDFLVRCLRTLKDAYKSSPRLREAGSSFRPLVFRQFSCLLQETAVEEDYPNDFQTDVKNFITEFSSLFPGRRATYNSTYSFILVKVAEQADLTLVVTPKQLQVLLLFNIKRKWSVSSILASCHIPKEVCDSILNSFAALNLVKLDDSSNEAELLEVNNFTRGTINLADFFLASARDQSFPDGEVPRSTASSRPNYQRVEAHIIKILKTKQTCTLGEIEGLIMQNLKNFPISSQDVKQAIKKLIEKNFVERADEINTFKIVP